MQQADHVLTQDKIYSHLNNSVRSSGSTQTTCIQITVLVFGKTYQ